MNIENTKYLFDRYEFFHPYDNINTSLMGFGFDCDDGWFNLIDQLCWLIEDLLYKEYPELKRDFQVVQVKEKFGTLHFYVRGANDKILDLIDKYGELSSETCEWCGGYGKTRNFNHWYITLCPIHCKEYVKEHKIESVICD